VKDIFIQLGQILKGLSPAKKMALAVLIIATLAGIITMISWSGSSEYAPLFTKLTPEDAGEILSKLREQRIPYRIRHNGSTIEIPREKIYETRLGLASEGLPRGSGIGFEVFDETKLGITEFVQNINYQRALQGELSRTINGLEEVESCRVHIVMPKRSLFIEDRQPATASIILKLRSGRRLAEGQVRGIVHLVSASVPNLKPDNVTVVDGNGRLLAGDDDSDGVRRYTSEQLEYQQRREKSLEAGVRSMLEKALGKGKAIVRVACDIDFMRQEETEEKYLADNKVVRSEQLSSEQSSSLKGIPAGVPGLASNVTGNTRQTKTGGRSNGYSKKDQTRNYEIGKVVSRRVLPVGKLKRLSVAVIVDGTYKKVVEGEGQEAVEKLQYEPRSPEELKQIESLVKNAVNFDPARGDRVKVTNMEFYSEPSVPASRPATWKVALAVLSRHAGVLKYLAVAAFVALSFLLVIKPLVGWLTTSAWEELELLEQLPKTIAELENEYDREHSRQPVVAKAAEIISKDQQQALELMQKWLSDQ